MIYNRKDIDWIEDYLDGTLCKDDVHSFEYRLKTDSEFAEEYRQRLALQEKWISAKNYQKEKERVLNIIQEEKSSLRYRRNILLAAASLFIVAGLVSILIFILPNESTHQFQQADNIADSTVKFDSDNVPQQLEIPKYGKSDTVYAIQENEIALLFPIKETEFRQADTIHFQWRSSDTVRELIIKEKSTDSIALRIILMPGQSEYMLEAGKLKAGNYFWFIDKEENSIDFIVK
jgi:hypothetical protein